MKGKIKIFVVGLVLAAFLLNMVPVGVCEGYYPDLTITDIWDTHNGLRTKHTAWVWIKNIGNYPAQDTFTTTLYVERWNTETGMHIHSILKMWDIDGLAVNGIKLKTYTWSWTNPNPNVWQARFYAKVDYYNDIDEGPHEGNNWEYGDWFV